MSLRRALSRVSAVLCLSLLLVPGGAGCDLSSPEIGESAEELSAGAEEAPFRVDLGTAAEWPMIPGGSLIAFVFLEPRVFPERVALDVSFDPPFPGTYSFYPSPAIETWLGFVWMYVYGSCDDPLQVYTMTVTGTSASGDVSSSSVQLVPDMSPRADWWYHSPNGGPAVPDVFFDDHSSGGGGCDQVLDIVGWRWDFGDGTSSIKQNPFHHFVMPPHVYPVTLTITNELGATDSATHDVWVW